MPTSRKRRKLLLAGALKTPGRGRAFFVQPMAPAISVNPARRTGDLSRRPGRGGGGPPDGVADRGTRLDSAREEDRVDGSNGHARPLRCTRLSDTAGPSLLRWSSKSARAAVIARPASRKGRAAARSWALSAILASSTANARRWPSRRRTTSRRRPTFSGLAGEGDHLGDRALVLVGVGEVDRGPGGELSMRRVRTGRSFSTSACRGRGGASSPRG